MAPRGSPVALELTTLAAVEETHFAPFGRGVIDCPAAGGIDTTDQKIQVNWMGQAARNAPLASACLRGTILGDRSVDRLDP